MKKLLLPVIFSSLLVISACNKPSNSNNTVSNTDSIDIDTGSSDNTNTDSSDNTDTNTDTTPVDGVSFEGLVNKLLTTHNYTMDVHSCLEDAKSDEIYDDTFENINDKAFYSRYYSGHSGIIYQKNQGYVPFIQYANGTVEVQNDFYSTNTNVGVSSIYDIVAENLFLGEFVQSSDDNTVYYNSNTDAIAVGCNFTGYAETANLVAPEKLIAKYDATNEQIIVTVNYDVWFYDEGEQNPKGTATLTIKNIGTTTNVEVESYVENPTTTFNARTEWNANDISLFASYFNGKVPSFLAGSSYALFVDKYNDYRGNFVLLTDYASGDLRQSFGDALVVNDNFVKVNDNKYTLVEKNDTLGVTTTYTIEMVFKAPNDQYNDGKTFGHYYPNGLFQATFSIKTVENTVDSISSLNKYIQDNKYDLYVPTLPFGSEVTKVSGFNDRTRAMNAEYGNDMYAFYTSTTGTKLYIESLSKAKENFNKYSQALRDYGYTEESSGLGLKYFRLGDDNESYVSMSDLSSATEANYSGYIQIRFNVYSSAYGYTTPTKSEDSEVKLSSITLSDMTTSYNVGDTFSFDGVVTAHYSDSTTKVVNPTEVTTPDMTSSGYKTVIVTYTENGVSKDAEYTITVTGNNDTNNLLVDMTLVGGSIKLISPTTESYVEPGEMVKFVVKVEEGYELEKVFLKEDPNYTISVNPMGTNSFFFVMPEFKVTITASIKKIGGETSNESYVGIYRDVTNTESDTKASVRAITLNDDMTGTYSYRNKTSFGDSTYVANFTWSVSNDTVSFVLVGFEDKTTYKSFASYKMFITGETGETMSGTISLEQIEIQLYDSLGYAKETTSIFEK